MYRYVGTSAHLLGSVRSLPSRVSPRVGSVNRPAARLRGSNTTQRRRVADHPSRALQAPVSSARSRCADRGRSHARDSSNFCGIAGFRYTYSFETGRPPDRLRGPRRARGARPPARPGPGAAAAAARPGARGRGGSRVRRGSRGCRPGRVVREPQLKKYITDTALYTQHGWFTINDLYAAFVCNRPNARSLPFLVRLRARAVGLWGGFRRVPARGSRTAQPPSRPAAQLPSCTPTATRSTIARSHVREVSRFPVLCCVH
jgi:hypothetical protein